MKAANNMHTFTDPDLIELDRIWPLGQQLVVPENGTIIVAGAYEGRYMEYLSERFPTAQVTGFEPQVEAWQTALARTKDQQCRCVVHNYGLSTATRSVVLGYSGGDGASVAEIGTPCHFVEMRDAVQEIHRIGVVDLMVLNCEGAEWSLIPYLLDELCHHRIASMAIQWHPKYVSDERSKRVLGYLAEYYNASSFDYPTWTQWTRK